MDSAFLLRQDSSTAFPSYFSELIVGRSRSAGTFLNQTGWLGLFMVAAVKHSHFDGQFMSRWRRRSNAADSKQQKMGYLRQRWDIIPPTQASGSGLSVTPTLVLERWNQNPELRFPLILSDESI